MLQALRTRAGSIIVKALFALLIISFGFWGIYTRSPYFQDNTPDTEIATVGDATVRVNELQAVLEPALQRLSSQLGTRVSPDQVKQLGILNTLLDELIDRSLIDQEAQRLQLNVSDDVVRSAIEGNPTFHDSNGQFDRNLFNQVLAMNNLSEQQFVAKMRTDVPRTNLLLAVTAEATAPPSEVDALYRYHNETRIADIVALPLSAATDVGAPSDADLNKFYEAHQDLFRAPEYRAFTLVSLSAADLAAAIHIPDDKLRAEYDERKSDFAIPEERDVQQILAPTEAKAKEAEAALAGGKDWNTVATTIAGQSADTIDLGLVKQSELPSELATTAFSLELGKSSQPVQTPLGWHILRVVKIVPALTESFEQAKPQLVAAMAKEEAAGKLDDIGHRADDALGGGATLDQIVAKFGLKKTVVAAADAGGRAPDGKPAALPISAPEVLKIAFATDQSQISRVVATDDGSIFAVQTDKIIAPRVRPLSEVRATATAAWQQQQKQEAVVKEAAALAAGVSPSTPLKSLAAQKKLAVTTSSALSRQGPPDASVPPALIGKLFSAKPGATVTAEDASGAYVAQLDQIKDPGPPTPALAAQSADQLTRSMKLDLAGEFTAALRQRFPVKIDQDAIDRAF
jgi:peptidyl-prolyl cis-trans isomerase D